VALEELGLAYEHVPLNPRSDPAHRAVLDALNPNSHMPVLDDDGLIVWESMAINLYLADKCGGPLWPARAADRALTYQWSLWAQTEIDRADWNKTRRSGDDHQIAADRQALIRALGILDRTLEGRDYLLGEAFSIVDANVAASLSQPNEAGLIGWQKLDADAAGLPLLGAWLRRCTGRASYDAVRALP
jgi:glutathione S-transferase